VINPERRVQEIFAKIGNENTWNKKDKKTNIQIIKRRNRYKRDKRIGSGKKELFLASNGLNNHLFGSAVVKRAVNPKSRLVNRFFQAKR